VSNCARARHCLSLFPSSTLSLSSHPSSLPNLKKRERKKRKWSWEYYEITTDGGGETVIFPALTFPSQFLLVLLINVSCSGGKTLGSLDGKVLGSGLCYQQKVIVELDRNFDIDVEEVLRVTFYVILGGLRYRGILRSSLGGLHMTHEMLT
jgi:hypothetical protein